MLEVKMSEDGCISCCEKGKPTRKININRDKGSHKGDNIVSFSLCNECLNKLARELQPFS